MFKSGQVQDAWTKAVSQLPHVYTFEIGARTHSIWYGDLNRSRECFQSTGEALFSTVLASLIAARSRVEDLRISSFVDGQYRWANDGTLDALDLSQLRALTFQPACPHRLNDCMQSRFKSAIVALLSQCRLSLRHLSVFDGVCAEYQWPPKGQKPGSVPSLPALETFATGLTLFQADFASFVKQLRRPHKDSFLAKDFHDQNTFLEPGILAASSTMGSGSSKQSPGEKRSDKELRRERRKTHNGGVSLHNNDVAGIGGGPGGPGTAGGGGGILGEDFGGGGDESFLRKSGQDNARDSKP
ncbi:hypothetical protein E8E13_001583 [Curvularia kusanoi]|uniref:Uncharacterized protein n=1 Tax=Curvularia kusanoi TaxID=90978 RepID=A0A9P4W7A1_CURKU|nr:hypothetical protein E8E13_001583 [Curvularia kusanoi]